MEENILTLNDTKYVFNITLSNSSGSIQLPKILFTALEIEESFLNWGFRGYLIYDNNFEQLERYKEKKDVKNSEFFYFRMDGTDQITIDLTPKMEANTDKSKKALEHFPSEKMFLKFDGIVYDTEDLTRGGIDNKLKKIYFWDYNYNLALNSNLRVSTGEYLSNKNSTAKNEEPKDVPNLSNADRSVPNSEIVKYILETKMNAPVSDDWGMCANKSFYVSPPSSTVLNDLDTLLGGCINPGGYPEYFYFDRFEREFKLVGYDAIFKGYKDTLRERMRFTDPTNPNNGIVPFRSDGNNTFEIPSISNILTYKYNKMSGADSISQINSRLLSGYDAEGGRFLTNIEDAHIENVRTLYTKLLDGFTQGNRSPLLVLNERKIENYNVIEKYGLQPTSVVMQTIEASLMLNDSLVMDTLGLPYRTPGSFVEIYSETDTQGIWEDRFLGTWFLVGVTHSITTSTYTNKLVAVKPNMSDAFKYPDGTEQAKQKIETKDVNR